MIAKQTDSTSYAGTHPALPFSRESLAPVCKPPPFTTDDLMHEAAGLFAYALAKVRDHHSAEDLVQDVLLVGWKKRHQFEERSKLGTWLIGILKFKILDHFRAKKRTPTALATDSVNAEEWGGDLFEHLFDKRGWWKIDPNYQMDTFTESPHATAERDEIFDAIRRCIDELPARLRLLFILREVEQLSVDACAAAADVTPGSAAVLLTRARHRMRGSLQRLRIESSEQECFSNPFNPYR